MIYYGKTLFGRGPKLIAVQVRRHLRRSGTDAYYQQFGVSS
jgi:hypothetical protein